MWDSCSLVPRLSRNANIYRGESLVSFLRKHDVIKIGPKQKGNVFACCSTNCASTLSMDARQLDTCSKLFATFALFPFLSRRYAHAQLSSFYPLSTFQAAHMTKNTRLSTPAQLQCSHSRAWEPGNEARIVACTMPVSLSLMAFARDSISVFLLSSSEVPCKGQDSYTCSHQ